MLLAFIKGFGQLFDPAARRVVRIGLGLALAILLGLWFFVSYLLGQTAFFAYGWLNTLVDALGGLAALALTALFFPAVVTAVMGFMLEGLAGAVERRHYPHLRPVPGTPMIRSLAAMARFFAVMLLVNGVALIFLLIPPVFPFVFYAANGYLLSREYFELVALRRLDGIAVRSLMRAHRGQLFAAGIVIAFLLTVPVINLLAPIVATAAMVHLFEAWRTAPYKE